MPGPLGQLRVLELTTAVAGPIAGIILADMGAEVIKIAQPSPAGRGGAGTVPALEGAPDHPWNRIPYQNELHRGKQHLALDLASEEGRALYLRLVESADVVVENFSPRVMANLRIDYDDLKAVKPDIVMISMPAFGKTGPYALRGSYGPGIDAMSGLSHLSGYPDRGPGKPANFYCDQNAGMIAALSAVAAIRHRNRSGEGQYIELSMLEGELQVLAPAIMDASINGREQMRIGNRHAWNAPHGIFRCEGDDDWVALAVESDAQWQALCTVLDRPDLASDARFATTEGRKANEDEIDPQIEAWTAQRDHHEAQQLLQAAGVPTGAVLDIAEVHADRQLAHRGSFDYQDHPEVGPFPHTRTAWRSRRGNHGVSGHGSIYGGATDHVLKELLGMSDEEAEAVVASGVVAREPLSPPA
ncbi:MAG TPA: CoA transferase [Dehalococcoidia bacterium]|nr:CoA transferase [Dehalococcoidia bacterium]